MRRFGGPDKGFAKQRPGPTNCGWSEPWEGAVATDLGERNPGAAVGGGTHTVLLCAVLFAFRHFIFLFLCIKYYYFSDSSIVIFCFWIIIYYFIISIRYFVYYFVLKFF
jgi:hypothetical protein